MMYSLQYRLKHHFLNHQDLPKYAVIGEYSGEVKDYVRSPYGDGLELDEVQKYNACCWVSTVNEEGQNYSAGIYIYA